MHRPHANRFFSRSGLALLATVTLVLGLSCADEQPAGEVRDDGGTNADGGGDTNVDLDGGDEDTGEESCTDIDQDGFHAGVGCSTATDCNDRNADVNPDATEECGDRVDNDCNGTVDESCPCSLGSSQLCATVGDPLSFTNEMRCVAGIQACVGGQWAETCDGEVGPAEETCNDIDDDCDGMVDEGLLNAVGQCADGNPDPTESCGDTGEGNGLDDDGDGEVDEDCSCAVPDFDPDLPRTNQPCYSGPVQTLGVGVCRGGNRDCNSDGTWGTCNLEVLPTQEVCGDGLDNDCDGRTDENCSACVADGDEQCDGSDNDCDGVIDEGVRNACGGCGDVADEEVCGDGLDNNCDGRVDEGCACTGATQECFPGPPENAGVGACRRGTQQCDGEFFEECEGYTLPTAELCGSDGRGNGIDDDCDGVADEGCGCAEGATRACGPTAGACEAGIETCNDRQWGLCEGTTGPFEESCDAIDNDCDGLTDEGLLNACGTCGESCYLHPIDPTAMGEGDEGVQFVAEDDPDNPTDKDGITLSRNSFLPPYLWAANHEQDTVTKFNTDLEEEEGVYWVADNASRTAVDLDGNMWVGGRNDGRLTKVLWDTTACPDRNGNGMVDTSRNNAGIVNQLNSAADIFADECVVYSDIPYPPLSSIRGVAAAPDGKVWIGFTDGGLMSIDPNTFELGPYIDNTGAPRYVKDANGDLVPVAGETSNPGGVYGLVVDANGHLYTSSYNRNTLARFDTNTETWVAVYEGLGCGSYGIAVDAENRIWVGGWPQCGGVGMFDPDALRFYTFAVPATVTPTPGETAVVMMPGNGNAAGPSSFQNTGVGVEPATGDVWCSFYQIGYTGRLRVDNDNYANSTWTFIATTRDDANAFLLDVGADLRGVGFDRNGFAWTLGLGSNRVWKIDPETNLRAVSMPTGRPIGQGTHYTYSDFTGSTALSFTAPRGFWRYIFEAEFEEAQVDALVIDAHAPMETTIGVRIRALNADGSPRTGWLPPDMAGVPDYFDYPTDAPTNRIDLAANGGPLVGPRFEVETRLTTQDRDIRPIVHDVRLEWQRP